MKTVLVLGAGLVSQPLITYLDEHGYKVIVGNRTLENAQKRVKNLKHAEAKKLDITTEEGKKLLKELVPHVDAVVSLLPYIYHAEAAEVAIDNKKHFLTTSYVSDKMAALKERAEEAGVVVINECGVDPGTDHMSAMKIIHDVHSKGGKVLSFLSYCGGLPSFKHVKEPNPLGYKVSWTLRGVLLASGNNALFKKDGKDVSIPGSVLFDNYEVFEVEGRKYEGYPNRDSVKYIDIYGIPEVQTLVRGTYREAGWCKTVKKFVDLGLLKQEKRDFGGMTYAKLVEELVSGAEGSTLKEKLINKLSLDLNGKPLETFEWLGLLSEKEIPSTADTNLDALCQLMEPKMQYVEGETDMIVMQHTFLVEHKDGKKETIYSKLIDHGIPGGATSMSRTVTIPVAIATRLVLERKFTKPGLSIPIIPELYDPILEELEKQNPPIRFVEEHVIHN